MTSQIDVVLSRLQNVRRGPRGWSARCPAHDDRGPSLSIGIGRDGRVLLNDFAGCPTADIARAIGLELRDLFGGADARVRHQADAIVQRRHFGRDPKTLKTFIAEQTEIARAARVAANPFDTPVLEAVT